MLIILLARNLPFDSDVRQLKPFFNDTMALFGAKSNNRTSGQFEYDVTLVFFVFV